MNEILTIYKDQQSVERGFRFLKSPDFLTSAAFLKKPERIEALLMLMTTCLMIYAALEHKIRTALVHQKQTFPDMKNKPTQQPTARWVFQCFQGIAVLYIQDKKNIVLSLKPKHELIYKILGESYQKIYS